MGMPDQDERDLLVASDQVRGKPRSPALPKLNVCPDIGLKIGRDGTWSYRGSPIERKPLVKLFATVLRQDDTGSYWLQTPGEKVPINVEGGIPFVAVEMRRRGRGEAQRLIFRTNVDDTVTADAEHPIEFAGKGGDLVPLILVRDRLKARLAHRVYYELADMATEGASGRLGIWSSGAFFPFPASDA
jgi:uncharacterized protein